MRDPPGDSAAAVDDALAQRLEHGPAGRRPEGAQLAEVAQRGRERQGVVNRESPIIISGEAACLQSMPNKPFRPCTAIMCFTPADEETRAPRIDRWCFNARIDTRFPLMSGRGRLERLTAKDVPNLGPESYLEML